MKAASFGHFCRNWSATWRSIALAWARSGCREGLAQRRCYHALLGLGDIGEGVRIQCTRQRCQPAPNTRRIAALRPSWASEMTSLTPRSPRRVKLLRKPDQKVSASGGPICSPTISVGRRCWPRRLLLPQPKRCGRPRAASGRWRRATNTATRRRAGGRGRRARARRSPPPSRWYATRRDLTGLAPDPEPRRRR